MAHETRVLPLTPAQKRMWFLHGLTAEPLYNLAVSYRVRTAIDASVLQSALRQLVARHDALRARFFEEAGEPLQRIDDFASEMPLPLVDVRGAGAQARAEADRLVAKEVALPFDLANGPLIRARLLKLGLDEHILVLAVHHIVADGWSLGVISRELAHFYDAALAGRPPALPPLTTSYAEAVLAEDERHQPSALNPSLGQWRNRLAGLPTLEIPGDRQRPATQSFRGGSHPISVPEGLTVALENLAGDRRATLFMTLLAGFQALLARYADTDDVAVGVPVAHRSGKGMSNLVGPFLNTVVVRTEDCRTAPFTELISRVRATVIEALQEEVPFEQLVKDLKPERDPSRNPLVQVLFQLYQPPIHIASETDPSDGRLLLRPVPAPTGTAKVDLELILTRGAKGLTGVFEYSTDLFDAPTIESLGRHLINLLEDVVAHPDRPSCEASLLDSEERDRLLGPWSTSGTDLPPPRCIHDVFEEVVDQSPDAIAIVDQDDDLTFGQLNARANQLAHYLRELRVGKDAVVGICAGRSSSAIVGMLGVLKSGAAYLPLDPAHPPARIAMMLADAGAKVVVADPTALHCLPRDAVYVVSLDEAAMADHPETNAISGSLPDDLAYVIYTSGSTGTPKGVAVEHASVFGLVFGMPDVQLRSADVVLQSTALTFDVSVSEIWGSLLRGARCVVFRENPADAREVGRSIRGHGVTAVWLTPSVFNQLVDDDPKCLQGVGQLVLGGEAPSVAHVRRAFDHLPGLRIVSAYGPTETTVFATSYVVPRDIAADATSVPIGRPITDAVVYVLDNAFTPAPAGVPGELFIGGGRPARGYIGRTDLTAERFIPDPFQPGTGARLYRSGDIVRFLRDGTLEFVGRRDGQVKIRGCRVEIGEVEAALCSLPVVSRAVVLPHSDPFGGQDLAAFFVPSTLPPPDGRQLRTSLGAILPDYMIPRTFSALDALPFTTSGKVDRHALISQLTRPSADDRSAAASESPTESALQQIFSEVLGVDRVGIEDNFFDLGGHSLLAAQMAIRIRRRLGAHVPLRAMFEAPTIRQLAPIVDAGGGPRVTYVLPEPDSSIRLKPHRPVG